MWTAQNAHRHGPAWLATLLLAVSASAPAVPTLAAAGEVVIEKDVAFLGPDQAEKVDLYRPREIPEGRRVPAVVIIHGGGWVGGKRDAARELGIGTTLAENGYVGLSIDYLLSNDAHKVSWPQNLYDCKTAVRWLRKNADRLRVDPDHIGVIGGSAGGHLSAMVAATGPEAKFDPSGPYGEFPPRVQAAVILYGPVEMDKADRPWLGKTRSEDPSLYREVSPLAHL